MRSMVKKLEYPLRDHNFFQRELIGRDERRD
jgi:hypothetical protein